MPAMPLSATLAATFAPPVMEARAWVSETTLKPDLPLLNLSQAAPVDPPPAEMREAMARALRDDPDTHLYGPVLGLPALRETLAQKWSAEYGGAIRPSEVAITSGCNQAFCAAVASLATQGDAILLPLPWYFNHKMWLDMAGVEAVLMPPGADMLPDVEMARRLMTPKVKAIALVSPNNPTGAEYPAELLRAFADLCRETGTALILDETYRDFHSHDDAPHDLFTDGWQDVLIHLYSFSKVFRLTGHRVGALICNETRLAQIEKFLDTVAICPGQVGQHAALYGLQHMGAWVAAERVEILARRAHLQAKLAGLPGWRALGLGAYFAYLAHPFEAPSNHVAKRLLEDQSILCLPGTMFGPTLAQGGDGAPEQQLRVAFANADAAGLDELIARLGAFVL
ncbi:MAG: aminotransferase [Pseudomonadota bacterium]